MHTHWRFTSACLGARATLVGTLIISALLLCAPPLPAQRVGTVSGRVITQDGEPVTDAVLTLIGSTAQSRVDDEGRFEITGVAPGPQLISVSSVRHASGVKQVEVIAGEAIEVEITLESTMHAEEIVVTATGDPALDLDIVTPVNILEGQALALRLEPTLGETLSKEVGITQTYFAAGASRPVIRGLSGDRVKMMENGLDTLDASSTSPDHAVSADPMSAERIEVVRGPVTLLYGSNAIGGAVNQIDRRIPEHKPTSKFFGSLNLRGGTVADERAGSVDLNGGGDRFAWHLDYATLETDDYDIPGFARIVEDDHDGEEEEHEEEENPFGTLPNSDVSTDSGAAGGTYFFGDSGFLGVSVAGFDSNYGVPGGHHEDEHGEEGGGEHDEEGLRIDLQRVRYDLRGAVTRQFSAFRGATFRFGYVDYEHDELEAPGVVGTSFFNDSWEARAELLQKNRDSHTGSIGFQARSRDLEAVGEEAYLPPTQSENLGIFTFQEFGGGAIRYQFGLRYETQEMNVQDPELPDRDFDGLSASAGLVWTASESYSLGASLARSVKFPSGEELYSEGIHFATSAFEIGDPNLEEESALGAELSFRKSDGRLTGAINLFYNSFSDYIFQAFTGEQIDGFPVLLWSQADADFWGGEVDLTIALFEQPHASWDLDLFGDLVRAEFADGGNLPRIPPMRIGGGIHYRSDRLRGGGEVWRVAEQNDTAITETPTAAYTMVNADFSYRIFFSRYFLDLMLRGTNLTDEEARMHTSFVKDSVPLPGRNISLIAKFGF